MDVNIDIAAAYLQGNCGLKSALGIESDCSLNVQLLGMGEHNINYVFTRPADGCRFVLRINVAMQPFHDCQVRYEYGALKALKGSGRTPRAYFVDSSDAAPGLGALVIEFCDGRELDFNAITREKLAQVAAIMADVHAVEPEPLCPLFRPKDPLQGLLDECLDRYRMYLHSPYEDARITRWTEEILHQVQLAVDACSHTLGSQDLTHIIHTEPLPSHFLLPEASGTTQAHGAGFVDSNARGWFIDWERPIIGEVAQDVSYFISPTCTFWDSEYFITEEEQAYFVDRYWETVDGRFDRGSFDRRLHAYLAVTAFRSITWCCRALTTYRPESSAHQTPKAASKLPIYLSDEFLESVLQSCQA